MCLRDNVARADFANKVVEAEVNAPMAELPTDVDSGQILDVA